VAARTRGACRAVLLLAGLLGAVSCSDGLRRYPLRGVVQAVLPDGRAEVAHEDIPGFMPGMTMPFRIRGASGVRPGDRIEATLAMRDTESWLEDVRILARGLPVARREAAPEPARIGTLVPDLRLVDQDGAPIGLAGYRGRVLVLTFIYTRCPVPEFCPRMMTRLSELDDRLAADPTLLEQTQLLAISFDPEFDTPEVLRYYGKGWVKDRGRGRFDRFALASGSAEQVKAAADFFGVAFWNEAGQIVHTFCTAVIDADGRLAALFDGNEWTTDELLREVRAAAARRAKTARQAF